MMSRFKSWAFQAVVIAVLTLALLEALVVMSFRYPRASPMPLTLTRYLHMRFDRNVIQVMPECARFDDTVTYTLRPGRCVFSSREFSNEYRINSLGVRDDEASLNAPDTVFLGDSLAMGWGVNDDEAFPSVYERLTGRRTLNAAISSYGTVRQLRLLERIDRSAMKHLVIQYNENDTLENSQLVERPPFKTLTREQYDRTVEDQAVLLRYWPGKYAVNVLIQLQSMIRKGGRPRLETSEGSPERQGQLFVGVLERTSLDLTGVRVTVAALRPEFIAAVREAAAGSKVPWVRTIDGVEFTAVPAMEGAVYVLDDHPTARGQEAIGRLIAAHLSTHE